MGDDDAYAATGFSVLPGLILLVGVPNPMGTYPFGVDAAVMVAEDIVPEDGTLGPLVASRGN